MNMQRKLRRALIWSLVGFAIPVVVLGMVFGFQLIFADVHPMDREQDIAKLPVQLLFPAIGCAFVFALAAYASGVNTPRLDFIRSLMIVSVVVVVAKLVVTPNPRYKMPDPNAWMEIVIPIVAGLMTCGVLTAVNRSGKSAS